MNDMTQPEQPPKLDGLDAMREPFPANFISKLPKGTKAQNECPPDQKEVCKVCGGWHHPKMKHLDYVGHAAVTQRLLNADPRWYWEPLAYDQRGLPAFDDNGGLWIRLTVAGMTRLGYGDAAGKHGHNAVKEAIGDALRNASMRFGAALELWHKGDWESDTLPPQPDDTPPGDGGDATGKSHHQEKPTKTACPDAKLDKWIGNVKEGKAPASELLAFVEGKHSITDAQRKRINDFVKEQGAKQ